MRASLSLWLLVLLAAVSCAPVPGPKTDPGQLTAIRIPSGPDTGFTIRQELVSKTSATWRLVSSGREPVARSRDAGLRLVASFTITKWEGNNATVEVRLEKIQILHDGSFIDAPFVSLSPPDRFPIDINFKVKTADFSVMTGAFASFAQRLKGTVAGGMLVEGFDHAVLSSQMGELLRTPPLGFSGRRYPVGQSLVEWVRFRLPFIGPSISFGPFPVMQMTNVVKTAGKRDSEMGIAGEYSSEDLLLSPEELAARFALFGAAAPTIYESQGTLLGTQNAVVSAGTGWTLSSSSSFQSRITANFANGELVEEIRGERTISPLDPRGT